MRLAGAGSADQHGVALLGDNAAARQIADLRLVDRRAGKIEIVDVLGQRQFGNGQLVLDRARLLLGDLGGEQVTDNARRLVAALDAIGHHLVPRVRPLAGPRTGSGRTHAIELEPRHQLENIAAFHHEARRRLS